MTTGAWLTRLSLAARPGPEVVLGIRPEDIADAVLFLASPRSAHVNGDEIVVDGAFTRNVMSFIPRAGYEAPAGPAR